MIRTSAPTKDDLCYDWTLNSIGQCTWYCYFRAFEEMGEYPTWWNRATKTGKYTNAKLWVNNYRDLWVFKEANYKPIHGDIIIWDGNYGHVAFVERNDGETCLISQYNLDAPQTFSNATWKIGERLFGKKWNTGNLLGYLHYPLNDEKSELQKENETLKLKLERIEAIIHE